MDIELKCFALFFLLISLVNNAAYSQQQNQLPEFASTEILVKFKSRDGTFVQQKGESVLKVNKVLGYTHLRIPQGTILLLTYLMTRMIIPMRGIIGMALG